MVLLHMARVIPEMAPHCGAGEDVESREEKVMTKKHFQALADALKSVRDDAMGKTVSQYEIWEECCAAISAVCGDHNPRFDRSRFLTACGLDQS